LKLARAANKEIPEILIKQWMKMIDAYGLKSSKKQYVEVLDEHMRPKSKLETQFWVMVIKDETGWNECVFDIS